MSGTAQWWNLLHIPSKRHLRHQSTPRTILYNLNPADSAMLSTMAVNYAADGAKVQYGAAWWLLDHIRGIGDQIDQLMETGLLSGSVGMLTDSRAFTSTNAISSP